MQRGRKGESENLAGFRPYCLAAFVFALGTTGYPHRPTTKPDFLTRNQIIQTFFHP